MFEHMCPWLEHDLPTSVNDIDFTISRGFDYVKFSNREV